MRLNVKDLACEYRIELLGSGVKRPQFSWRLQSDCRNSLQESYRLLIIGPDGNFASPLWDSGRVKSDQSIQVRYSGPELESRKRYFFRVKLWNQYEEESAWSEESWFETGLFHTSDWLAGWITPEVNAIDSQSESTFLLRKGFELEHKIASARVYATAAGVYELYINGGLVSEDLYAPGWTSYSHRLQYQTYDVTQLLRRGENAIGIHLGDGWYKSGMYDKKYGEHRAALIQLNVIYEDGTEAVIISDQSWTASIGPITNSTIYHGESYDARLEQVGWSEANFDDTEWKAVQSVDISKDVLVAQENWPTRVTETLYPISAFVTPAGDYVLDMGQNMVGRIRFSVQAPAGTCIKLRHAEVLDKEGNIYFGNLRSARQTVIYTTKGEGIECYAPHFTFMGFRYVMVKGYPRIEAGLPLDAFVGEVIHSEMEPTGDFECSNDMVNQLQANIKWGQRGNFLDVPTDCPQRDERLGWTGDAQIFIRTALFNYQGAPFFTKWLRDLKAEQHEDGGVPSVIPYIVGGANSAGWGDAAVICPWTIYQYYGDIRLLSEQYGSMKAWVEYVRAQGNNEYLWNTGTHFGDWLALDTRESVQKGATPHSLIATAYYAYSTRILRDAAKVLGKSEDVLNYDKLLGSILIEFHNEFITPNGRVASATQTANVLALIFDLVEGSDRARIAADLNQLIIDNEYHLSTGFIGTPYLCLALSQNGYHNTAMKLLLQKSYPGWLYSVSQGATTIWEHWDSLKPDGTFWSDDMNSFNHYAYGAIGDWMYSKVAGLDMDPTVPAFKRIRIEPMFGMHRLKYARASYRSMYGMVESGWSVTEGKRVEVKVRIPENCTAVVILKGATAVGLRESNIVIDSVEGIIGYWELETGVELEVGSGTYHFEYENADIFRSSYTHETKLGELLDDDVAAEILKNHFPHLSSMSNDVPSLTYIRQLDLGRFLDMSQVTDEQRKVILAQL